MEENHNYDEFNTVANEFNDVIDESNSRVRTKKYPKSAIRLLASFIVACAVFAMVQSKVFIPVFSQMFSLTQSTETKTDDKDDDKSEEILPIVYIFKSITSTHNSINYSLELQNVKDFSSNEYSVMLVKSGCDTDEYILSISSILKNSYKIKLNSSICSGTLGKYISTIGINNLLPNTNYVFLLLKDEKIVKKQDVKTQDFKYITDVEIKYNTSKTYRYIMFQAKANEYFDNYESICYVFTNITTNEKLYSKVPKIYLAESYASFEFLLTAPIEQYELKIYCETNSPQDINYSHSFVSDEITYYLIYTHQDVILF